MPLRERALRLSLKLPPPAKRALAGAPVIVEGEKLDLDAQLTMRLGGWNDGPPIETVPAFEAREVFAANARLYRPSAQPTLSEVRDLRVAGAAGDNPGRLYVPQDAAEPGPGLLYLHGGGFIGGDIESHDSACRLFAASAGIRILSADYRLAPEHRFPAAIDDALAAYRFAVERAEELGLDPGRIAVGGDSAGGNLAAVLALEADPTPAAQVLIYPWLDMTGTTGRSREVFAQGYALTATEMDWYRREYLPAGADPTDPRCSPIGRDDLAGAPPALIAPAGFDPLRDEGLVYAERLTAAGVPVTLLRDRLLHGYLEYLGLGGAVREATIAIGHTLRGLMARA